jgi:hypothetical protein
VARIQTEVEMKLRTRRGRRSALALLVAAVPTAALAWAGCSSSSSTSGGDGRVNVDPGGTYGAEVTVTVLGRGRVTSSLAGVSCPGDCFARYVFGDRSEDGAAGGVSLKAIPTPGVTFAGWKFETTSLGARGRGPASCNPVTRESTTLVLDLKSPEIVLPYGEVNGIAPLGQEGACASYTTVPVAYNVTATFVEATVNDSGVDADAGGEVFLESPVANASAKEIGIVAGRLYWRYESGGVSAMATASTLQGAVAQTVSGTTGFYNAFEIGQQNVVWQTNSGTIGVITGGSTTSQSFSSGGVSCVAVESDFSNVFCRTTTQTIASWTTAGGTVVNLHSGLPTGTEIAVDSSYIFLVDTSGGAGASAIRSIPRGGTVDAGTPVFTDIATALTNPTQLELNTSRLFWIDFDTGTNAGVAKSVSRFGGTTFSSTAATVGLRHLALDPQSTTSFFVAAVPSTPGTSVIAKLSSSSTTPTPVRQNLTDVGGIAADASYVYWTQSDGRVYRAQRLGF